jgi:hypothetical protein
MGFNTCSANCCSSKNEITANTYEEIPELPKSPAAKKKLPKDPFRGSKLEIYGSQNSKQKVKNILSRIPPFDWDSGDPNRDEDRVLLGIKMDTDGNLYEGEWKNDLRDG